MRQQDHQYNWQAIVWIALVALVVLAALGYYQYYDPVPGDVTVPPTN